MRNQAQQKNIVFQQWLLIPSSMLCLETVFFSKQIQPKNLSYNLM